MTIESFFSENKSFCDAIFGIALTTEYRWQQFLETSTKGLNLILEVTNYLYQITGFYYLDRTLDELRTIQHQLVDIGLDTYKV